MDLTELLGEELAKQVEEKLGDNHKLIDTKEGNWIPKEKFDQVNSDNKELKNQLKDRDKQLDELKTKAAGNEDLMKQIEDLKAQNQKTTDEYEQKLQQQAFDHALENALSAAKVKNSKAVKALLDTESIKLDGEKLLGLDDQLKALKESDAYLFEAEDDKNGGGDPKPTFSQGQHNKQPQGEVDKWIEAFKTPGSE